MELLTKHEAAALLRISRRKLDYLLAERRLRRIRFGARCIRIERADVEQLVRELKDGGDAA